MTKNKETPKGEPGNKGVNVEQDFPEPMAILDKEVFIWNDSEPFVENAARLGKKLAQCGDLYRNPNYGSGLVLGSRKADIAPAYITSGAKLSPIVCDRVRISYVKGSTTSSFIPNSRLDNLLRSEAFLREFKPLDEVTPYPKYLPDFTPTAPGYTDYSIGYRFLYTGKSLLASKSIDTINKFLNVMCFETAADRTNAVAGAITYLLRDHFPGSKPLLLVSANKSQAGKDTVIDFMALSGRKVSVSYQSTDWAFQASIDAVRRADPEARMIVVENARLERGGRYIASAFLERIITDPEPTFYAVGNGAAFRQRNNLVFAISTNFGTVSIDLANRALPIHLTVQGDIAERSSPIGNPRYEFLPANVEKIVSELHGMIDRWVKAGKPLDKNVRHTFTYWAATVGGILAVNGFKDFLANYSSRRTTDSPISRALGLLGAAVHRKKVDIKDPDEGKGNGWLHPSDWLTVASYLGLTKALIPEAERENAVASTRGLSCVLSAHQEETFKVEMDDRLMTFQLKKKRARHVQGQEPSTRYYFHLVHEKELPTDISESEKASKLR